MVRGLLVVKKRVLSWLSLHMWGQLGLVNVHIEGQINYPDVHGILDSPYPVVHLPTYYGEVFHIDVIMCGIDMIIDWRRGLEMFSDPFL